MTQKDVANAIRVSYQRINEIINKKRSITPSTALRLAKFFGTSEDFWLNLHLDGTSIMQKKESEILKSI